MATRTMASSGAVIIATTVLVLHAADSLANCGGREPLPQIGEECKNGVVIVPQKGEDVCESKGYNQDCGGAAAPRRWAYNKNDEICDQGRTFYKSMSPGADHVCPIDAPQNRCQPYASAQVAGVYGRAKFCGLVGK